MMSTITAVFKYSFLVLTVLVLSHIIQIRGTTISRHVENGMSWITGGRSYSSGISRVTQQFSSAIHHETKEDADGISHEDKNELNSVIRKSGNRR